jgi:hypothetical protein
MDWHHPFRLLFLQKLVYSRFLVPSRSWVLNVPHRGQIWPIWPTPHFESCSNSSSSAEPPISSLPRWEQTLSACPCNRKRISIKARKTRIKYQLNVLLKSNKSLFIYLLVNFVKIRSYKPQFLLQTIWKTPLYFFL